MSSQNPNKHQFISGEELIAVLLNTTHPIRLLLNGKKPNMVLPDAALSIVKSGSYMGKVRCRTIRGKARRFVEQIRELDMRKPNDFDPRHDLWEGRAVLRYNKPVDQLSVLAWSLSIQKPIQQGQP